MAKEMMDEKMCAKHMKMKAGMMLILGLLILGNVYWLNVGWDVFIGAILVIAGLLKLIIPHK